MNAFEYSPYQLVDSLGRRAEGALVKFFFKNSWGVADCRPWVALGDPPLKKQLASIGTKGETRLIKAAKEAAQLDAKGREQQVNLLKNLTIPPSHCLLFTPPPSLPKEFTHFKCKVAHANKEEALSLVKLFQGTPFKLRLDFNKAHSHYTEFMHALKPIFSNIDFLEDPPSSITCGLSVAADRISAQHANYIVFKPALQGMKPLINKPTIVTSYLGHPIEQIIAAYVAAHLTHAHPPHGLLSHLVYEPSEFSVHLPSNGASWHFNHGTGWGFDEELAKLTWHKL